MYKIGNVCLDETYYPGEDLYSDGAVEERLLELAEEYGDGDCHKAIVKEREWAVMYHLAHERGNILSWYPFGEGAKILEVGSGCGAVTGALAARAGSVTCIDLSKRRSTINAQRNRERDNINIYIGNFQDIEKGLEKDFDYATLIGVFEYGQGYIGGEQPYHEFLTAVMGHIKPGGKLLLAIENKFGLKYWAGCTEDHVGRMFEGIEGYPCADGVRTFTKPELIRILEECGYSDYRFYYPHPDYKIPLAIYSDGHLPKKGGLAGNFCNFDRSRLALMDEGRVFDEILENGLFGLYANSFFVEITKGTAKEDPEEVVYAKYSNGRAPKFAIQTHIANTKAQGRQIYKKAEYEEGKAHIFKIAEAAEGLGALWQEKGIFQVNQCRVEGDKVYFEYLKGVTLEEVLDGLLEQKKLGQAMEHIQKAVDSISHAAPTEEFHVTEGFRQVFGDVELPDKAPAVKIADVDMIFSNLLLDGEEKYYVLDYEWTFFFPVPVGFIVYRALHYYLEGASSRGVLGEYVEEYEKLHPKAGWGQAPQEEGGSFRGFYQYFGISRELQWVYAEMERNFQKYISGGYVSLSGLYTSMGKAAFPLRGIMQEAERRRMQVYLDMGQGASEEDSYYIDQIFQDHMCCKIPLPKGTKAVLVDPAFSACIIRDVELKWEDGSAVAYGTTGHEIEKNCFLFDDTDPKIIIGEIPEGRRQIELSYNISILEGETAELLTEKLVPKEDEGGKEEGIKGRLRRLIKR